MSEIGWDSNKTVEREREREREEEQWRELLFSGVFIYRGSTCCQMCTSVVDCFCEI